MAEIYKNTSTAITNKLYVRGEAVTPSSSVVVKFYDTTSDPMVSPAINPATILVTVTAEENETDQGAYSVYLPISYLGRNRKLKLVWEWQYNSVSYSDTTFLEVVTPYVDIREAASELGLGSDANDPNHKSNQELRMAERYARNMIGDFNNWCQGYIDWNLFLDNTGGPNHVNNLCDAPIILDIFPQNIVKQSSYYYVGHFSKYVRPGAKRIGLTNNNENLQANAFVNVDGSLAFVVLNETDKNQDFVFEYKGNKYEVSMKNNSIVTVIV